MGSQKVKHKKLWQHQVLKSWPKNLISFHECPVAQISQPFPIQLPPDTYLSTM